MPTENISESSLPTTNINNPSDPSAEKGKLKGKDVMHIHKKVKMICNLFIIAALVTAVACLIIAVAVYAPPYIAFTALFVTSGISLAIGTIFFCISGVLHDRIKEKTNQFFKNYIKKFRIETGRYNECLEAKKQLTNKLEVSLRKEINLKHLDEALLEKEKKLKSLIKKLKEECSNSSSEEFDNQEKIKLERELTELKEKITTAEIECENAKIEEKHAEAAEKEIEQLIKLAKIDTEVAKMAFEAVKS